MKIGMSGGAPQCEELIVGRPSLVPVSLQHVSTHKAQKVPARRRWAHLRQLPASPEFSGILRKRLRPYVPRAPARMATRFAIIQSTRRVSMIQCQLSVNPGKIIDFYNRVFWETALQPIGTPQRLVLIARHGQRGCCQELYLLCVRRLQCDGCGAFCLCMVAEKRLAQSGSGLASGDAVFAPNAFR